MKNKKMPITNIWSKTFQICWVTNDFDHAKDLLKDKFDIPQFMVMHDLVPIDQIYEGKATTDCKMTAGWANGGNFDLELIQPTGGPILEMYGEQLSKDKFDMKFHHMGTRFDDDLDGYYQAIEALQSKGFEMKISAGIKDLTKYCYFDMRELLGHYLELIYFNQAGVDLMQTLLTNDFKGE
ncbi:Glyoxalase/Bleomycin resistance protein/Dioxygenase superfamily protein [Mucilaginibacter lappiensis]|uniref:Glyoxalase/Bleomycin resistance protein/Dioxygenase superfamily protein n=1 Tax=Mucilaginibacter lappiensis TaxID=354630 RepID=A0ABR6PD16_9SPHI|nr:VOC family protein [Mucilaginibacter lappiensis]MBB6107644.1 hypothetical protein [Mucilaginibacter lappiensis]SIQ01859.1 Glyoxalase/Bleomycin resistance protein/Dioxygenase superfamily protein [Mucilaginibacter lappiensis]